MLYILANVGLSESFHVLYKGQKRSRHIFRFIHERIPNNARFPVGSRYIKINKNPICFTSIFAGQILLCKIYKQIFNTPSGHKFTGLCTVREEFNLLSENFARSHGDPRSAAKQH